MITWDEFAGMRRVIEERPPPEFRLKPMFDDPPDSWDLRRIAIESESLANQWRDSINVNPDARPSDRNGQPIDVGVLVMVPCFVDHVLPGGDLHVRVAEYSTTPATFNCLPSVVEVQDRGE